MKYKIISALLFTAIFAEALYAETINFGNSFFNKDRANTVSKIIVITNNESNALEYNIAFTSHPSMQTSDIKTAPLTDEVYDAESKEFFSSITKDSCIQHYGETIFSLNAGQKCRLHITFSPTEVKDYNEEMVITSRVSNSTQILNTTKYEIRGKGIHMPDFTVIYYTDRSGENMDNKRAEYSIKWNSETAGVKSDEYAYIKILLRKRDKEKLPLTYKLEGSDAFAIDTKLSTCKIKDNTITEPETEPCGLVISFRPNVAGDFAAKLVFNKRILSGAKEYLLYGSASDMLDFGTVYFGGNVQKILVQNTTDNDQRYSILSESKDNNFRLVVLQEGEIPSCIQNGFETNFELKKASSCYLGFTFAPDRNDEFYKKVIIMSNSGERREVTLRGKGVEKLQEN